MPDDRLAVLKNLVSQNPGDPFARYGLAMELVRVGRLEEAVVEFDALLASNPSYLAAYYPAGQALEKLGRLEDARERYRRGIEVAARAGNSHARDHIQTALDMLA